MRWNLLTYLERLVAIAPLALKALQAQTEAGFVTVVEELLEEGIGHLEANAKNLESLGETGLTAFIVLTFNKHGIRARQEANSNGHVDLHIENNFRPALVVCGEAKIYSSPSYHLKGLGQVMLYATARCGFAFVIEYVRDRPVAAAIAQIRTALDAGRPMNQAGACQTHALIRSALSSDHRHPSGRDIRITHIGAFLPAPK